jgi:hypothetical protein
VIQAESPQITVDAVLIGTIIVRRWRSFAFFSVSNGSWRVEEGEELGDGARLRQVRTDRIVIERQGAMEEIRLGSLVAVMARGEAIYATAPGVAIADVPEAAAADALDPEREAALERALELRAQKFQALLQWSQRPR